MKAIVLSPHAVEQMEERGATVAEVEQAIREGVREGAKRGRWLYRMNFEYNGEWLGEHYAIKQVAPVAVEERDRLVVVTVFTFYF